MQSNASTNCNVSVKNCNTEHSHELYQIPDIDLYRSGFHTWTYHQYTVQIQACRISSCNLPAFSSPSDMQPQAASRLRKDGLGHTKSYITKSYITYITGWGQLGWWTGLRRMAGGKVDRLADGVVDGLNRAGRGNRGLNGPGEVSRCGGYCPGKERIDSIFSGKLFNWFD